LGSRMGVWAGVLCLLSGPPLRAAEPHPRPETPTAAASPASPSEARSGPRPDELAEARKRMRVLYDAISHIRHILEATHEAVRASCVDERLADARAHLRLGNDELAVVQQTLDHPERGAAAREADARTRALARLDMLVARTREAERAAEICVADDRSSVDVTEVKVEIGPQPADEEQASATALRPRP